MSPVIKEWLIGGRIHLGTITRTDEVSRALKMRDIFSSPLYLVTRSEPGQPTGPVGFEEAVELDLVLTGKSNGVRQILDAAATQRGLELHPAIEVDSVESIRGLLLEGAGATILPRFPLRREIDAGLLTYREVTGVARHYQVQLATSIESPPSRAASAVAELVAAISSELVAQQG